MIRPRDIRIAPACHQPSAQEKKEYGQTFHTCLLCRKYIDKQVVKQA
jgi:hypothetical protein